MVCECCTGKCVCKATDWQLLENGTKVDGDIIIQFPVLFGAEQVMQNSGSIWYPYWYEATGAITYTLEIKCDGDWVEIDTWDRNLELCQGYNARWFDIPFQKYDLSEVAPDCGDCRDDTTGEPRDPIIKCFLNPGGYTKDKVRGWDAYIFLGTDDDEWTNTNNWLDRRGRTPAARFHSAGNIVYVFGDALKNSFDDEPLIGRLEVGDPLWAVLGGVPTNPDGKVGIALVVGSANFYNESELLETGNCGRVPDMQAPYAGGHIVGPCNFYNSSILAGQVVGGVGMHNNADITAPGEVYGLCVFNDSATHHGYIEGTADFFDSSSCVGGKVCGNVVMHNSSIFGVAAGGGAFVQCDVALSPSITCAYDLTLHDSSSSIGATVCQDVYIIGPSSSCFAKNCTLARDLVMYGGHTEGYIDVGEHVVATGGYFGGTGLIESAPGGTVLNYTASLTNCTISGPFWGTDSTVTTIYGDVELSNSHNYGVIWLTAIFNNGSTNEYLGIVRGAVEFFTGSANGGTVCTVGGNAVFVGAGSNNNGTVEGTASFPFGNANFSQGAKNYGIVKGVASFSGEGSDNYGHVEGNAIFASGALNYGTCETNATFTTGASNFFGGVVQGNATFNASSNLGDVVGDATLTAGSGNGGTIQGNAVFTDSSSSGSVVGTATFNVTGGVTGGGTVGGLATFNGATINAGVLAVNAIFNNTSHNEGSVSGTATFNNSAYNNAIVTGVATFNNTSHNDASSGVGTAIFNNTSINNGSANVATFNNSSSNAATVSFNIGTATFNNTSENNGYIGGSATFNNTSANNSSGYVAGTATFNNNSNNYGAAVTIICNTNGVCP